MLLERYVKFLVNGGLLGLAAWGLQAALFQLFGAANDRLYSVASLLTYIPLILFNFAIQKRWIFTAPGRLSRFIIANAVIMLAVSALSPLCREFLAWIGGSSAGDRWGFALAALIVATPSFLLSHYFVFRRHPGADPL